MFTKHDTAETYRRPIYLDCNATTPIEPDVAEVARYFLEEEFGNDGSRTHLYGTKAKQAVQKAREQVAICAGAKKDEVIFTSGATESNNLAILGLAKYGEAEGRRHIITTGIEHKAVLEPVEQLEARGFEVTKIPCGESGAVDPAEVEAALRKDTLLVSVMHANNETGVLQPIDEIGEVLGKHPAFFHTDAAQTFGKFVEAGTCRRVDLISISGHKIYGPKGIGALIVRKRGYKRPPLEPILFGGGQERGLRPGTIPVFLVAAFGKAAELADRGCSDRWAKNLSKRDAFLKAFSQLDFRLTGDESKVMPHVVNLSIGNLDSEALIVALKEQIAISNGSACTSASYTPSHVLTAMGMTEEEANRCIRISWCHMTPDVDWDEVVKKIRLLI